MRLQGKIALITGAGSGIGQASALLFAKEGAAVVAADINEEAAQRTAEAIAAQGGKAIAAAGDVSDADDARRMVEAALSEHGRVDVLFNNAGIGHVGAAHETDIDDWDRVIRIHVRGAFLMTKFAVPSMMEARSGTIINMSSAIAQTGLAKRAAYAAAKGAILALTRSMAVDYAPYNIRVNALCPGTIYTPFVENYLKNAYADPEEALKGIRARQLTGELGRAEDVAHAALYLASDEARFVVGAPLIVDGGLSAGK